MKYKTNLNEKLEIKNNTNVYNIAEKTFSELQEGRRKFGKKNKL